MAESGAHRLDGIAPVPLRELAEETRLLGAQPHGHDDVHGMALVNLDSLLVDRIEIFGFHVLHDGLPDPTLRVGDLLDRATYEDLTRTGWPGVVLQRVEERAFQ